MEEIKQQEPQEQQQEQELTREERLEIEEKAIQTLIDMGVKFNVPLNINPVNQPWRIAWWNRPERSPSRVAPPGGSESTKSPYN